MNDKDREYLANHLNMHMGIYFQNCYRKVPEFATLGHFLAFVLEEMTNVDVLKSLGKVGNQ